MSIDEIIKKRIETDTNGYSNVAIYGTGFEAKRVIKLMNSTLRSKIVAVIDKDDSMYIGKQFLGFQVCRLIDVVSKIQLILIANNRYKYEIEARLKKENDLESIKVISLFDLEGYRVRDNSLEYKIDYISYLEKQKSCEKEFFVPFTDESFTRKEGDAKLIAWYLPQYYPILSNDEIYGVGFTEWTNSSKALPMFVGHYQPHIPYHVGYYSLESVNTLINQALLAKHYGIYGFCIHYYWFSGKKTMEKPIYMLLNNPEVDIKYCFNWATEDWVACWDGGDNRTIYKQEIRMDDPEKFMDDIYPFFIDERYIKVNEKPMLVIYSIDNLEKSKIKYMIGELRRLAVERGLSGLYILITDRYGDVDSEELGADGIVEYPVNEHLFSNCPRDVINGYINPYYRGEIYDLRSYVNNRLYISTHISSNVYYSCFTAFDNSPRKGYTGIVINNSSPEIYKNWLIDQIERNNSSHLEDNFTFIGSWNEWAEGSHLEPDHKYGYAYLQASMDAIIEARK